MSAVALPAEPVQSLPREAYTDRAWFERERRQLFSRNWTYACNANDIGQPGDYVTLLVGEYPLLILRTREGALRAFHNLCRHRGTELLEGAGRIEGKLICPYHRWTYDLDGSLVAVPNQKECFPGLERSTSGLLAAGLGEFKGMVFVHPEPDADFPSWLGGLDAVAWPHDFGADDMVASATVTYEMRCNWKVFYENAIDGYHLGYLHDKTLGPVRPSTNVWDVHGRHLVWYATDSGPKRCLSGQVADYLSTAGATRFAGTESGDYGGVYMLFPNSIVTTNPYGMTASRLVPTAPGTTLLIGRSWYPASGEPSRGGDSEQDYPGYDPDTGYLKLDRLETHALETGDFHWEDVWICEKMQRSLDSPAYRVGALARGAGAESSLAFFQQCVLDYIEAA